MFISPSEIALAVLLSPKCKMIKRRQMKKKRVNIFLDLEKK